jgi:type VI secretion system Hcp family effector
MRRASRTLTLVAALLVSASAAQAQNRDWYLYLEGSGGAISPLSGTVITGLTNETKILSYGQNFYLPLDAQGVPGALQFRPLRLLKEVDGASPRLAQALANSETILTCTLTLYDYGMGPLAPLYEIQLIGAQLIGVSSGGDTNLAMSGSAGTETVSIAFASVKQTDVASGQSTTIP